MPVLRLVLGDQLSEDLSSLSDLKAGDRILMAEVMAEATYVRHHKQKLVMVFSAMRQFAQRLRSTGADVRYVALDDPDNTHSLGQELCRALTPPGSAGFTRIVVTEPGEWRLHRMFSELPVPVPLEMRPDTRFLCSRAEFASWAHGQSGLRMEFFYRWMRKRTGLLMQDGQPAGGRWNLDTENRKRPPTSVRTPRRLRIPPNAHTRQVMQLVRERFADNFGDLDGFGWATNSGEATRLLDDFLNQALPHFGPWEDAMRRDEPFMWHGLLSAAINIGLLDPLQTCRMVEAQWQDGRIPLNSAEGFIRQIIGWREFVRGMYWLRGPEYTRSNYLGADRRLPWFYWSGETDLACVADVVKVTRENAYAHHIQRLMITGNLALLLGVHPDQVNEWYMVVFADAFEWVEAPNTHGMALFADGGAVGSKPYAAGGAYINRMSDYCGGCAYDVKRKRGPGACPFNVLYWDFLIRNSPRLQANPRLRMPYQTVQSMRAQHVGIREEAEAIRAALGAVPL